MYIEHSERFAPRTSPHEAGYGFSMCTGLKLKVGFVEGATDKLRYKNALNKTVRNSDGSVKFAIYSKPITTDSQKKNPKRNSKTTLGI